MPTYVRDGGIWKEVGGAGGGILAGPITASVEPFFRNPPNITINHTITPVYNEMSIGPMTINSGVIVTVNSGASWTIV